MKFLIYIFLFFLGEISFSQTDSVQDSLAESPIFVVVEEMPRFPGGNEAFKEYISSNCKFSKSYADKKNGGQVKIRFNITEIGSVDSVRVIESSDISEFDVDAVSVISSMPKWEPGKQNGKGVKVIMNIPLTYGLNMPYFLFNSKIADESYLVTKSLIYAKSYKAALKSSKKISSINEIEKQYIRGVLYYTLNRNIKACNCFRLIDIQASNEALIAKNVKSYLKKYCSN